MCGTYARNQDTNLPRLPVRTFFVCSLAGAICTFWVYLLGPSEFNNYFGRGILPLSILTIGIVATLTRYLINGRHHRKETATELLYLGFSDSGRAFLKELKSNSDVRSVSVWSKDLANATDERVNLIRDNNHIFNKHWHGIIIDPQHNSDRNETERLVALRLSGTDVMTMSEYYERNWYKVPVDHIADDWFIHSQGFSMLGNTTSSRIKRIIDVVLSLTILTGLLPFIIFCSLIIKLTSKGPVIFRQTRVGLKGTEFQIYKFRTMIKDAELNGAQWAESDDPRVTKFGKFLRKSRFDELPQCWNILKGEMSFVGPRPERPEFTRELSTEIPYYDLRHIIKPGLSGWAQVLFPYGSSKDDALKKFQYELFYIKNQSLIFDLNIILRTILVVFKQSGR